MLNKKDMFSQFSKQQKSSLCHSVKIFVKQNYEKENILSLFLENERYYIEIKASRLSFIKDFLDDERFLKDLKLYFSECIAYYDYQKSLEPYKQAQKEFVRQQRKKASEYKMSKEIPTKRQISYYKSLCKKYNIEPNEISTMSKLDLKNIIGEIMNEHKTD